MAINHNNVSIALKAIGIHYTALWASIGINYCNAL
jgi:hypothetical protein